MTRLELISRVVWAISLFLVICCVLWAILVENLVPDACTYPVPPPNAQFLHCD